MPVKLPVLNLSFPVWVSMLHVSTELKFIIVMKNLRLKTSWYLKQDISRIIEHLWFRAGFFLLFSTVIIFTMTFLAIRLRIITHSEFLTTNTMGNVFSGRAVSKD